VGRCRVSLLDNSGQKIDRRTAYLRSPTVAKRGYLGPTSGLIEAQPTLCRTRTNTEGAAGQGLNPDRSGASADG
jgi:hypothetical protein